MARRFSRPVPRWALVATGIAGGLVVVATVAAATTTMKSSSSETKTTVSKVVTPPPPPAVVTVANLKGTTVPWDKPLTVTITGGKLLEVGATQDDGGTVSGTLSADATRWQSAGTLVPLSKLMLFVSYLDEHRQRVLKDYALSIGDSAKHLRATLSPDGAAVGIGQPVIVTFNRSVPETMRADVQRRLSVTTSPAVDGAWHWFGGEEVHWRPPSYWAPGTKVTVHSDLSRLAVGDGVWGAGVHTASFTIGAAHVSKVDVANHVMRVYSGGQLVKTMPISAGRDKYPTMGGVHVALEKAQLVVMDSATVGIPRDSPDGYYEKVYWNVRITNGGAFVHAAPWSVGQQGVVNVSHGCINLSPDNATWFYNFARRGDIVDIYNTPRPPSSWDAGTMDWNMSWSQWVRGSALPDTSAAAAPATATTTQPAATATATAAAAASASPSPTPSPSKSPERKSAPPASATPSASPKPTATATGH